MAQNGKSNVRPDQNIHQATIPVLRQSQHDRAASLPADRALYCRLRFLMHSPFFLRHFRWSLLLLCLVTLSLAVAQAQEGDYASPVPSSSGSVLSDQASEADSGSLQPVPETSPVDAEPSPDPRSQGLAEVLYALEAEQEQVLVFDEPQRHADDGAFILSLLDGPTRGEVVVEDLSMPADRAEYQPSAVAETVLLTGSGSVRPPSDYETDRIMPSATPLPPGYEDFSEDPAPAAFPEYDVVDDPIPQPAPAVSYPPPSPTPDPDPTLPERLRAFEQAALAAPFPPQCPERLRVDGFVASGSGTILFPLDPDGSSKELILGMLPAGIDVRFDENGDRVIRVDEAQPFVRIDAFRTLDSAQRGSLSVPILFTRSWGTPFATVCSLSLENFFSPTETSPPTPELSF